MISAILMLMAFYVVYLAIGVFVLAVVLDPPHKPDTAIFSLLFWPIVAIFFLLERERR
jgi:hypothetical protein